MSKRWRRGRGISHGTEMPSAECLPTFFGAFDKSMFTTNTIHNPRRGTRADYVVVSHSEHIKWIDSFRKRPILLDMSQSFSHPPEPSTPVNSTRSSFTYLDPQPTGSEKDQQRVASPHSDRITAIASRGEDEFERYGGDDIHEPPPKPSVIQNAILPSEKTIDVNMVTWEGPNDPTNPQNWTIKHKWLVTLVIIIMTVNV